MSMKPSLQLKLGTALTLTPQLRQAIHLLQLSALELEAEISAALDSNPLLEREDEQAEVEPGDGALAGSLHDSTGEERHDAAESAALDAAADTLDYEPHWDDDLVRGRGGERPDDESDPGPADPDDLHDHLLWQLHLCRLGPRDRAIGVALIEAIDDDGYLHEPLHDIAAAVDPAATAGDPPEPDEVEAMLHRIQRFDPVGCGARSLSECLLLQLEAAAAPGTDDADRALARRLAERHLEQLAKAGPERLARQLDVDPPAMQRAVGLLRALNPRPGAGFSPAPVEYIVPDAYAVRRGGLWRVSLGPGATPKLGINRHYESLIGRAGRDDASYLRGQLQEARWLIRAIETRADTVLRVAQSIVRHQSGFLDHGPEAMRPLILRDVADELGLHESTISRVTSRKYLHTPRGTFEFKHFFSTGLATDEGGATSATAVQAVIQRLVAQEDPRRPLSDARLADLLKAEGVNVARRTVAKYRELMNIPASNERQRLA